MRRQLIVNQKELHADEGGQADLTEVEPGVYSVLRNGTSYEARVISSAGGYQVEIGAHRFATEVRDPRVSKRLSKTGVGGGPQNVKAPMPGKVVRVLVESGQDVEAGQGLLVVEAMKMQNEMKAAKPGKVTKIHTQAGATVSAGEVLMVIE